MTRREQLVVGFVGAAILIGSGTALWLNQSAASVPADPPDSKPKTSVVLGEPQTVAAPLPAEVVPAETEKPDSEPETIVVSIQGAIEKPGVYAVTRSQRVYELLELAGGLTEGADIADINLAAELIDGTTLTVPGDPAPEIRDGVAVVRKRGQVIQYNPPQYTLSGWSGTATPESENQTTVTGTEPVSVVATDAPNDSRLDLNRASAGELEQLPGIGPVLAQSIIEFRENTPFTSAEELQNVRGIGPKRYETLRDLVTVNP